MRDFGIARSESGIEDRDMDEAPPGFEIVLTTRRQRDCLESRFVLTAVGIPSQTMEQEGIWYLLVSRSDSAQAATELAAYRQENPHQRLDQSEKVPLYQGAVEAIVVYALLIMATATLAARSVFEMDWLTAGWMHAGSVTAGQWWRTITALTLHLDAAHLVANLIFGSVFGYLAGCILGGGVAWLAIVVAGAAGNLINAWIQPPPHTSIGASTAVFAALGLIVAHSLRPRPPVQEKWLIRWSPLIGGILLLAFTGVGGERTDVAAHVTGFLSGLLFGWIGCRLPERWLGSRSVQQAAGLVTMAIVAFAWFLALGRN
jgi:rhomboid protease GluP